jgi:DNA-binding NtrC family response regulator
MHSRSYPQLFRAMNEVLRALSGAGNEADALRGSFEAAAQGFGAQNALLLAVEQREPLVLRCTCVQGTLSAAKVRACERGESVRGVSPSIIRRVIATGQPELLAHPLAKGDGALTESLAGENHSVLCAPIFDPLHETTLAVMYFQNLGIEGAYDASDLAWLEGYAAAVGRAFGLRFAQQKRERALEELLHGQRPPDNAPDLIGDSSHLQTLRRELHETYIPAVEAPEPEPILIVGERGTGKDLVARYLYAYSARSQRAFVAVNCAEITDELAVSRFFGHRKGSFTGASADEVGFFRAAHGGVLFLDEVGELSARAQGCLLRVLESRTVLPVGDTREIPVEVVVVLATNRDLEAAVKDGSLKRDFYDRFRTQCIRLLPLRERPWDIPPLLEHFRLHHEHRLRKKTLGFSQEAARTLISHAWPGNVRDLARACSLFVTHARAGAWIDHALVGRHYPEALTGSTDAAVHSPVWEGMPMQDAVRRFERELILSRLERHAGNTRATRESLGLTKTTFHRYLKAFGITPAASEAPPQG